MASPAGQVLPHARRPVPRFLVVLSGLLLLVVAFWLLMTSSRPLVPATPRPGIPEAAAARDLLEQLRRARGVDDRWAELRIPAADVPRVAAIGGHAAGLARTRALVEDDILIAEVSLPAGAGRWLNLRAATRGSADGVPPVRGAAGPLTVPPAMMRGLADAARLLGRPLGFRLPPYEEMVRSVTIEPSGVTALVRLPSDTGAVGTFASARTAPVSADEVLAIYCRLAAEQTMRPEPLLEGQVARLFARPAAGDMVESNRAALVALAMLTVSPRVGELAGVSAEAVAACAVPPGALRLAGRADLAKHWTLSAALAATLGEALSTDLGQWKELSDSIAGGSGFSFVDIVANRSGLAWAREATDPRRAEATRRELASVTGAQLFPLELLAKEEGLRAADFERRYGTVESPEYQAVVERIDRHLARARAG
jgi:hypothetical protein